MDKIKVGRICDGGFLITGAILLVYILHMACLFCNVSFLIFIVPFYGLHTFLFPE